ncbi:hypothetical protein VSDG_03027 [Cytospora chrysosperma]|uniref:Protein kinase domain-containing protein n=1 Tax=Cytospora chrysosperma TaxID=252740 RepID=A0A423W8Q5_CYTCH|nr:hypothetical protein VSDG_03027 [Valsa sordida]
MSTQQVDVPNEDGQPDTKITEGATQESPQWLQDWVDLILATKNIRFWSPPDDPDKPELPYIPGFTVRIHRHIPPPPEPVPPLSTEYLRSVSQSEAVVANPPPETPTPAQPETAQLTITTPIATGAARGSQVVACTVVLRDDKRQSTKQFQATAKIYDPLYYNFKLELAPDPRDVVSRAHHDYSTEAAAYEHLLKTGQTAPGSFAPEYYGTWTFDLPIDIKGNPRMRPVRLVLMERLQGTSIRDMRIRNNPDWSLGKDLFHFPEEYRLEVLARTMQGVVKQWRTGIDQADFAGRNIILVTNNYAAGELNGKGGLALPRIVLVDYNYATVQSLPEPFSPPHNPIAAFWGAYLCEDFTGWVPHEWQDIRLQREWLLRRFDVVSHLYQPLPEHILPEVEELLHADATSSEPPATTSATPGLNVPTSLEPISRPPYRTSSPPKLKFGFGPYEFLPYKTIEEIRQLVAAAELEPSTHRAKSNEKR